MSPPLHRYDPPLIEAEFVRRPHRFAVEARLRGGPLVEAHLPDPGRLREILVGGATLWLQPSTDARRKTAFSVRLAEVDDGFVGLDTQLPNVLVKQAITERSLPEFAKHELQRAEVRHGPSRFDFLLRGPGDAAELLEVKSVTLCVDRVGRFPDAPSGRATRHVRELAAWVRPDRAATLFFVVQRSDVDCVMAAREIDAAFADALRAARHAGVRLLARRCEPSPLGHRWGPSLPVSQD